MSTLANAVETNAGLIYARDRLTIGANQTIAKIALGKAPSYVPDVAQTALVDQVISLPVSEFTKPGDNILRTSVRYDATVAHDVTEVALLADDDTPLMIWSDPTSAVERAVPGTTWIASFDWFFARYDTGSFTVQTTGQDLILFIEPELMSLTNSNVIHAAELIRQNAVDADNMSRIHALENAN